MIFPEFRGKRVGEVHLNPYAQEWMRRLRLSRRPSACLDPIVCQMMVDSCHQAHDLDWSYDGYMADRSQLWEGSYITEAKTGLHLGVDFNARAGTAVAFDQHGRVVLIDNDHPEKHGWGQRVIVYLDDGMVLIYAHLANIEVKVNDRVQPGQVFATVGHHTHNGGWYPHVHVQAMSREHFEKFLFGRGGLSLANLDGYGPLFHKPELEKLFPDPMNWVRVS